MNRKIILYTPWREQGLSYDAKAIYDFAIENGIQPFISYEKKRKVTWPCEFIPTRKISKHLNENDIFFCFEEFPLKHMNDIFEKTIKNYIMINYEYYNPELIDYYKLFKCVFVKSKTGSNGCKKDALHNIKYLQWIISDFDISEKKLINDTQKISVLFNGGTGGRFDRRNFEAVVQLINNYKDDDVEFTIKLNSKIKKWSNKILKHNLKILKKDPRVRIIRDTFDRKYYKNFIKSFDINLAPSKFEGYGLTLLESMYSRVPTITLDASPMNEIVKHNKNGICMPCNQIDLINQQPVYQVKNEIFLQYFNSLVKNREKINSMKEHTSFYLKKMISTFYDEMETIIYEK